MINQTGVFAQSVFSCALILSAGCSSTTVNGGEAQGGQTSASGTITGGSSAATSSAAGGASSITSSAQATGGQTAATTTNSQGGVTATGGRTSAVATGGKNTGGQTTGTSPSSQAGAKPTGGRASASTTTEELGGTTSAGGKATGGAGGATTTAGTAGAANGGKSGGGAGQGGNTSAGGKSGTGGGGGIVSNCVGKAWPTANPAAAGPFQVATEKNVGPLAGYVPDPIYGDEQQKFNVYYPQNIADSGYCHPILIWANGHTDNPEPNPPKCVVDSANNKWCGQYLPMMKQLASHGFVVVASLSTTTSKGDPLPTIAGLDWIIKQADDSTSKYYHHLDTTNIGQLGHSEGAMSTCMVASEPRYKALMSICGTRTLSGVHTPMLFFCGGKDTTVPCSGVHDVFATVKDQPAFFMNEKDSDHGKWVYGGASSPSLSGAAAWFRIHLMGDTANRKYFYGSGCTFCKDSRVTAEQNSLMAQ